MRPLAFLSMDSLEGFVSDDDLTFAPLAARGWHAERVSWRQPAAWDRFDAVLIRTPWDYQQAPADFLATLETIEASGTPLLNPLSIVRWNLDKRYLRDLADLGVPIVPTVFYDRLADADLDGLFSLFPSEEVILKPVVSANAEHTYRLRAPLPDALRAELRAIYADRAAMVQPFLQTVLDEGEYSVFFFGGHYSHTIRKVPAAGDFRVQEDRGGDLLGIEPEPALRAAACQVVAALGETLLYARADLIRLPDGPFALMELELIEPSLYFRTHPDAPENFATAVDTWLAARER